MEICYKHKMMFFFLEFDDADDVNDKNYGKQRK